MWHQPCQRCKHTTSVDIQKRVIKGYSLMQNHMRAQLSLLDSGKQRCIKAINNSILPRKRTTFIFATRPPRKYTINENQKCTRTRARVRPILRTRTGGIYLSATIPSPPTPTTTPTPPRPHPPLQRAHPLHTQVIYSQQDKFPRLNGQDIITAPPAWGTADPEIKVHSVENPELTNVLPVELGVGQNIATHASPTARNLRFGG